LFKTSRVLEQAQYTDVYSDWCCPECHKPIEIKATIKDENHCDIRIKPDQLKQGQLFRLYGDMIFEIINCELSYSKKDTYRIALKNYGVVEKNKNEYVEIINGGWY
jgi:hypothetical protein